MISRRHKAGWANPAAGVSGCPIFLAWEVPVRARAPPTDRTAAPPCAGGCWPGSARGSPRCLRSGARWALRPVGPAGQVPIVFRYSCKLPIVGGTSLAATFVWPNGLQSATVGTRTPSLPVEVAATVGSAARTGGQLRQNQVDRGHRGRQCGNHGTTGGHPRARDTHRAPHRRLDGLWPADRACVRPRFPRSCSARLESQGRGRSRGHPPRHSDRDRDPERPGEHQRLVHPGSRPDWRRDPWVQILPVAASAARPVLRHAGCPAPDPDSDPNPRSNPDRHSNPDPAQGIESQP